MNRAQPTSPGITDGGNARFPQRFSGEIAPAARDSKIAHICRKIKFSPNRRKYTKM